MKSVILACFFTLAFSLSLSAQQRLPGNKNIYNAGELGIIYERELTFDIGLSTPRNIFAGFRSGKITGYDKMRYWSVYFGDLRHSREYKINPERFILSTNRISRSYVYGKQARLYTLRLGFGQRRYLSEKARKRGLAIGYSYELGPALALRKPYYLEIDAGDPDNPGLIVDIKYTPENIDMFLNQDRIFGASAWSKGFNEISFRPGVQAKGSVHFGFGAYEEVARSLEAGVSIDYYIGDTDIMIESERTPGISNSPLFISLFFRIHYGKRW